jgi:Meiotically up-regulated gene 113
VKAHTTGNPEPLTEFAVIETADAFKCEAYLHHRLRSRRSARSSATEFFEVDPDELSALIQDARHYVEEVLPALSEAERLSETACDNRVLAPTSQVAQTYRELLIVREEHDTLGFRREFLEAKLKLAIGTASGIERVADWRCISQQRLDGDLLRRERPEIYKAYQRERRFRRFTLL